MKKFQKIIAICIVFSLLFIFPQTEKKVLAKTNKYLILIQNVDGETYTAYEDNGLYQEKDNNLMINAKEISDLLKLDYTNISSSKFTIGIKGKAGKTTTYITGKKKYEYEETFIGKKNAPYAPYISNKATYVHYSTLGYLVKFKYFSATKAKEFEKKGYNGVLCYSDYFGVYDVPDLSKIVDKNGKSFFKVQSIQQPKTEITFTPSNQNSKTSNYLVLVDGYGEHPSDNYYRGLKGLVEESEDGTLMINACLAVSYLGDSSTVFSYHNIDNNTFSITSTKRTVENGTKTNIYKYVNTYTRNQKEYVYTGSNTDEAYTYESKTAPYISKNNGWDYIDISTLEEVLQSDYEMKIFDADHAKSYASKGYNGVIVFRENDTKIKNVPKLSEVIGSIDLSSISRFELEKLPSFIVQGVKIYGVKNYKSPSQIETPYNTWGYTNDLDELSGLLMNKDKGARTPFYFSDNILEWFITGVSEWPEIGLRKKKNEYILDLKGHTIYGGLKNPLNNYNIDDGKIPDETLKMLDEDVKLNRGVLKAFLYKISGNGELLYNAILNSWLADGRISNKDFTVVGDVKVKFDKTEGVYIIKSAK